MNLVVCLLVVFATLAVAFRPTGTSYFVNLRCLLGLGRRSDGSASYCTMTTALLRVCEDAAAFCVTCLTTCTGMFFNLNI